MNDLNGCNALTCELYYDSEKYKYNPSIESYESTYLDSSILLSGCTKPIKDTKDPYNITYGETAKYMLFIDYTSYQINDIAIKEKSELLKPEYNFNSM